MRSNCRAVAIRCAMAIFAAGVMGAIGFAISPQAVLFVTAVRRRSERQPHGGSPCRQAQWRTTWRGMAPLGGVTSRSRTLAGRETGRVPAGSGPYRSERRSLRLQWQHAQIVRRMGARSFAPRKVAYSRGSQGSDRLKRAVPVSKEFGGPRSWLSKGRRAAMRWLPGLMK